MTSYIVSRLLRALMTMLSTVSLVFILIRFSGDPAAALAPPDAPQQVIDQYAELMGSLGQQSGASDLVIQSVVVG